jgi:hypothetical protein
MEKKPLDSIEVATKMSDAVFRTRADEENGCSVSVGGSGSADFRRAMAISRNYIADREVNPTSVTFANGRRVFLNLEGFLDVETVNE